MLELKHVYKSFDQKVLFEDFCLKIPEREFIIVTGKSGCGKTTLLNMIGSIEHPDSGDILLRGDSIFKKSTQLDYLRKEVGFLFQNYALVEAKSVRNNFDLIKEKNRTGISFEKALQFVGLPEDMLERKIYTLSGGEQQRVAIARLLIKECHLVLADEPTGSLDAENAELVFSLLEKLNQNGKTIVMVTHDKRFSVRGSQCIAL